MVSRVAIEDGVVGQSIHAHWVSNDGIDVLIISKGKDKEEYVVKVLKRNQDIPTEMELVKKDKTKYFVKCELESYCLCRGFARHSNCKHISVVKAFQKKWQEAAMNDQQK